MKKYLKGLMVLSVGILVAGCSCNKDDEEPTPIESVYDSNKVYDDVSTNFQELYEEVVKSTVRISAGSQLGSGVVYKEEGNYAYILTNAHVLTNVSNATYYENIEVMFSNYTKVKGTFIYLDKNQDVGVISVAKSDNYTVAKIVGNDGDTQVGETVFSIGNPNGNYFAVTTGVISSNRIKTTTDYISGTSTTTTYVFNSTATINPGNSGGAMFNSKGEVIAINTMQPNNDTTRNYNYSIPVNYFIKVADYLVSNRSAYVGSKLNLEVKSICDYSVSELESSGITVKKGVYIVNSTETDLIAGRIITHINNIEIATIYDYEYELLKYSKGDSITLTTSDKYGANSRPVTLIMK